MSYHRYEQLMREMANVLGLAEFPYTIEEHEAGLVTLVLESVSDNEREAEIVFLGYRRANDELVISQCLDVLDPGDARIYRFALWHNGAISDPATPFAGIVRNDSNDESEGAVTFNLCLPLSDDELDAEALIGHIGNFVIHSSEFLKQATAPPEQSGKIWRPVAAEASIRV